MAELRRIDIKVVYDTDRESEDSITEEIASWEGVEDVVVLGAYRVDPNQKGTWPEDE